MPLLKTGLPDRNAASLKAVADNILDNIKAKLRERILEEIQPDIEEAVEAAVKESRVALEALYDCERMHTLLKVVIEDRRNNHQ